MSATPSIDVTLFRALHLATRQVTAGVEQQLQEAAGVSLPEFQILNALSMSPISRGRARCSGDVDSALRIWNSGRDTPAASCSCCSTPAVTWRVARWRARKSVTSMLGASLMLQA